MWVYRKIGELGRSPFFYVDLQADGDPQLSRELTKQVQQRAMTVDGDTGMGELVQNQKQGDQTSICTLLVEKWIEASGGPQINFVSSEHHPEKVSFHRLLPTAEEEISRWQAEPWQRNPSEHKQHYNLT